MILGGAYIGRGNSINLCSEFNFYMDPLAADIVMKSFKDITLVPLEVS